ncbi:hypothetical protein GFS31_23150 [Leptolyngbya sp. BL0902]|nr:hypothetical protein GFS31_23150 [Leptolyngbya sp. BL0902]
MATVFQPTPGATAQGVGLWGLGLQCWKCSLVRRLAGGIGAGMARYPAIVSAQIAISLALR